MRGDIVLPEKCPSCGSCLIERLNGERCCPSCGMKFNNEKDIKEAIEEIREVIFGKFSGNGLDDRDLRKAVDSLTKRIQEFEQARVMSHTDIENLIKDFHEDIDAGAFVYEKNKNSVMEISCANNSKSWVGTGFLLNKDGYALTNAHVVVDKETCHSTDTIRVKIAGEYVKANVVSLGDEKAGNGNGVDLALIKLDRVPHTAKPVKLGDFDTLKVGERIYPIGNAKGQGISITSGIVNDLNHTISTGKRMLMTDAAINAGNSGGPVFNTKGEVIGVTVSSLEGGDRRISGMHYIIPLPQAKCFLNSTKILNVV